MFWVGTPYTLRDQITWVTAGKQRWQLAALAGVIYGVLLLGLTFTLTKPAA
jgi:hypothetical protein